MYLTTPAITGKWTYAMVKQVTSDSIVFIVNSAGSVKVYNVKYWVSHVRTLKNPVPNNGEEQRDRRAHLSKTKSESRFSTRNLRPSTPSDDE
jgi:hypothetical protein